MIHEIKDEKIVGDTRKIRHVVLINEDIMSAFPGWYVTDFKLGQSIQNDKGAYMVSYNNVKMIKNK